MPVVQILDSDNFYYNQLKKKNVTSFLKRYIILKKSLACFFLEWKSWILLSMCQDWVNWEDGSK